MNLKEAVIKAQNGDQDGFAFLYDQTYQSKYYLALKYMKNKEAAEDVLQDAYLKAFSKLNTLKQPEAFEGWLGMIVANTAKNVLVKKNPLLFSEMAVDQGGEEYVYDVEDEDPENQPELSYTREETKELVHLLMDSLSEEQRIAILMFHIENASIAEIAQAMDCSENTVKSRLNYGRKNLKIKAEELQKKGYKLYSVAPVLLLIYLLRNEQSVMASDQGFLAEGNAIKTQVLKKCSKESIKTSSKSVAKGSIVNKIAAIAVTACVVGGSAYGIVSWKNQRDQAASQTTLQTTTQATTAQPKQTAKMSDVYKKVLTDVKNGKYDFSDESGSNDYYYFLRDMNKDGIKELIVAPKSTSTVYTQYDIRVFSCTRSEEDGYQLSVISGDQLISSISTDGEIHLPDDGNGLLFRNFSRGTGVSEIQRLTIQNGELVLGDAEQTFDFGSSEEDTFVQNNPLTKWIPISDTSAMDQLQ